jgi:chemotaxis protein CheX
MKESPNADAVARQFGLEAVPLTIRMLGELVSRPDATTDDLAKVLAKDANLTARLLRAANPRATDEEDYTVTSVDAALMRMGMGCALLLVMGDALTRAMVKTAQTMLNVPLKTLPPSTPLSFDGEHVMAEVGFQGKATGLVLLRLPIPAAPMIAEKVLGLPPQSLTNAAEIDDVICELANIVGGNFKSNLCDAKLECKLKPPRIRRTDDFQLTSSGPGQTERLRFRGPDFDLIVDLIVNPWDA